MRPFIRITRHPYEEPYHVNLVVSAGNGILQGEIEIYANAEDLIAVANALSGFPESEDDTYIWELGSENEQDRYAFYFRFRVFQTSANGKCAIELRFNNNQPAPAQRITEFCIESFPADLDRLGSLLKKFSRLEDSTMEWTIHPGT